MDSRTQRICGRTREDHDLPIRISTRDESISGRGSMSNSGLQEQGMESGSWKQPCSARPATKV